MLSNKPGRNHRRLRLARAIVEPLEQRRLLSLTHLYTFNDGSFGDTAGTSAGSPQNGATIANGALSLANSAATTSGSASAQYGLLAASILPTTNLTLEAWYTASNLPTTAHLFDFGTANQSSQLYLDPHTGSAVFTQGGHTVTATGFAADTGSENSVAIVIDASASQLRLYENGALAASASLSGASLSGFTDTNSYLGRSNLSSDGVFNGSIDEVRIFDQVLPDPAISTDAAVGPTVGSVAPINIGTANSPGTGMYSSGTYTITSSAATIGSTSDSFAFSNINEFGDVTLITEITGFSATTSGALAGLMLRDGSASGAEFAGVLFNTNGSALFDVRTSAGASVSTATKTGLAIPTSGSPLWLKLVRSGQNISGYYSTNGSSYTQIGSTQTFGMNVATLGGLAVASSSPGSALTVTFLKPQLQTEFPALNFTAAYTATNSITLNWGQRLGLGGSTVTSYTILRGTNGTSFSTVSGGSNLAGSTRSFVDTTVSANTTYYYEITATFGDGTTASNFTFVQSTTAPAALEAALETNWTTAQYITAYENYETSSHVSSVLGKTPTRFTLQDIMFCAGLYRVTTGSTQTAYLNDCISELTSASNTIPGDINFSLAEFCYIYDQIKSALTSAQISTFQTAIDTMANDVISQDLETGTDFNRGISDMLGLAYSAKLLAGGTFSSDAATWTNYYTTQFNNTFLRIQDTDEDAVNYNSIWLDCLIKYVQVTGMDANAFYSNSNVKEIFYRYMQETSSLGVIPNYGEYSFGETIYTPAFLAAAGIYGDGQFTYAAQRAWNFQRLQPGATNFVGIDTSSANTDYWPAFDYSTGVPAPVAPPTGVTYEDQRWGTTYPDKVAFNTGNNGTGTDVLENLVNGMSHGLQDATAINGIYYDNAVLLTSPMTQYLTANDAGAQNTDDYEEYQNELLDEPIGNSFPELPATEMQFGSGQWIDVVLNLDQGTPQNPGGVNLADITSMELRIARGDAPSTADNYDVYLANVQASGSSGTTTLDDFSNGIAWDGGQIVTTNLPPGLSQALKISAPTGLFPSFQLSYPLDLSSYSTLQFWMKLTPEAGASGSPLLQFGIDSSYNGDAYSSRWAGYQFDTYHEGPVTQMGSFNQMQFATVNSVLDDTQGGNNNQLRTVLVLPGGIVLVRDQVTFGQNESAQIGPVWNVQNILSQGADWFETRQDVQTGQQGLTAGNLFFANQENMLLYFVPQAGDQIGDGVSPYALSDTPFGVYQKWSGAAYAGQSETFNTIMMANAVGTNASALAATVQTLEADNIATVLLVGNDYVVVNPTSAAISAGGLQTNAEYLTIQLTGGTPSYLAGSEGSYVILNGATLYSTSQVTASFESNLPGSFAAVTGSTLNINLSPAGPVALNEIGTTITANQNGFQSAYTGITAIHVTDTATNDVLNINGLITQPVTFTSSNTVTVDLNSGSMTFAATPGNSITIGSLAIAPGASAVITSTTSAQPTTLKLTALSLGSNATLDVANNVVQINYGSAASPISTIAALIASGYHAGAWNGAGIISTTAQTNPNYALGYADSADAGNPANLPAQTVEVKYTLLGDADLNGLVNGIDLGIVAANFNQGVTSWDQGDFDYNTIVNGIDFGDVSANFNQGASIAAAPVVASPAITNSPSSPARQPQKPISKTKSVLNRLEQNQRRARSRA